MRRWCACIQPRRDSHPGRLAALAKVAVCAGDAELRLPQVFAPSARIGTTISSIAKAFCASALIARVAHGRRHGYDASSIREPLASHFYDVRYRVDRNLHAVERNRILSGLALGYTPQGAPDFGLDRATLCEQRIALRGLAACNCAAGKAMAGDALDRAR